VVTPERSERGSARMKLALAFGGLGGPLAWVAHLGGSFLLVPWVCSTGRVGALHLLTVVAAAVAAAATGVALAAYRRASGGKAGADQAAAGSEPGVGIALGAMLVSAFFLALIVMEALPLLMGGDPCALVPTLDDVIIMRDVTGLEAGVVALFPLLHDPATPGALWSAWNPDLWILGALLAFTSIYVRGVRRLWGRAGRGRGLPVWRVVCYLGGVATLVLALISPIDALSAALFSVHMTQHMLLMVVAAPLLVLGNPMLAYVWALPKGDRVALAEGWRRARVTRAGWRMLSHPLTIFVLHVGALWIWHVPELYEAALEHRAVHTAEHASFLFTAMLFWWALTRAGRRGHWPGYGAAVLYVFGTALQSGALGALLMFSPAPLYRAHAEGTALWGLDLLVDQQLAGALMWVPAGLVYTGAILVLFLAWLGRAERASLRRDGSGWRSVEPHVPYIASPAPKERSPNR
jgi:putative membrane protein